MLKFLRPFKETDADATFFAAWIGRTQALHGAVFGYVEALVLLAALRFAAEKFGGAVVWGIYYAAWGMQVLLTIVYVRALLSLLGSRLPLQGKARSVLFWALGGVSTIFAIWVVGAYADLVSTLLAAGIGT